MDSDELEKTKDYSEEYNHLESEYESDLDEDTEEDLEDEEDDDEIEENEDEEELETEEEPEIKDTTNNIEEPKKNKTKTILILFVIILIIITIIFLVYFILNKKNNENNNTPETNKIVRPDDNLEYTILKQSYFIMSCKKTSSGDKYKELSKGLVIDCTLTYELNSNQKISELYFDLNNSANVKLKDIKNESGFDLINNDKTYKLTPTQPQNIMSNPIHFYYEVLNGNDETGYVEISNIVFKDDNNNYYKVINGIETFPPEYDDKIYIYKDVYEDDNDVYYFSSKNKLEEQELFDTFQCKNESCMSLTESNNYFLISDDNLLIYDTVKKVSQTIKTPDNFKVEDYSYELMQNQKNKLYGVLFKKNYVSAEDCSINEYICVNTGLSGSEIGYYSVKSNMFTIALDYGFIGEGAYNGYDVALMVKKGDKYGIFSYEDDDMMLELTDKYKAMEYNDQTETIMLEVYDSENKEYYFEYFDPVYSSFTIDTEKLEQYESDYDFYYTESYNRNATKVIMFFDKKGNQLKTLPYAISDDMFPSNGNIVIHKDNFFNVYNGKGNYLYKTKLALSSILGYTKNYVIAKDENKFVLYNTKGEFLVNIDEVKNTTSYVSSSETSDGKLIVIIKDSSITEENKNAYKYTIEINKPFVKETIYVE